ncbi:MAG TPA: urea carboxylase-associated family protein [candidate division Zixibacteria bacterium]|nr:urea carboxylase-associated family protein [candidate division Zixibacteria bacterium]
MALAQSKVVAKNSGAAFAVRKGQLLRVAGRSIVDLVAFNLHDVRERFDQARTKTNQAKIFISTGDVLYSKRNNPMLRIVRDTFTGGRHDLQKGMCSRRRFEMVASGASLRVFAEGVDINPKAPEELPDHGCWENLSEALRPWNIDPDDVPSPFNLFQCMRIDPDTGAMYDTLVRPKEEACVDFRAEMDCLVAVSACPESGRGGAIRIEIHDGEP